MSAAHDRAAKQALLATRQVYDNAGTMTPDVLKARAKAANKAVAAMQRAVVEMQAQAAVRESVLASTAIHRNPKAPPTIGHVPGLLRVDQSFAPYLSDQKVTSVVQAVFGCDAKITFTTGQTNYPGCERQEWHADWPFAQTGSAHICAPYADATCHNE